jgi:hypothetical protein
VILDRRMVMFAARIATQPRMSLASTTIPAVLNAWSPLSTVSDVPAGTPVVDASGNPPGGGLVVVLGVGLALAEALGDGLADADGLALALADGVAVGVAVGVGTGAGQCCCAFTEMARWFAISVRCADDNPPAASAAVNVNS